MTKEKKHQPLFTVFTGTYNRGKLLYRVYNSLLAQELKNFEWLIVDDGSTDDTRQVVGKMIEEGLLRIRYFYKENGGVHSAHNIAIEKAEGFFFARCDSDDEFLPHTLCSAFSIWGSIQEEKRSMYSGILFLNEDDEGNVIGDKFPKDEAEYSWRILSEISGDKMRVYRTDILRIFPFPVFKGEKLVPESLVWGRIHEVYKMRCVNLSVMRVHRGEGDRLSWQVRKFRYKYPNGYAIYYLEEMKRPHSIIRNMELSINYIRVMLGMKVGFLDIFRGNPKKVLSIFLIPIGFIFYKIDKIRGFV